MSQGQIYNDHSANDLCVQRPHYHLRLNIFQENLAMFALSFYAPVPYLERSVVSSVSATDTSEGVWRAPVPRRSKIRKPMFIQKTTFRINRATRLFRNSSLVITTGGSWEPSSGSYDAERHSLLDS